MDEGAESCFICLNSVNNNKYEFSEYVLENMPCDCYRHTVIHTTCFDNAMKAKQHNIDMCLVCRSRITKCVQHPDYEWQFVMNDWKNLQHVHQTFINCIAAVNQKIGLLCNT